MPKSRRDRQITLSKTRKRPGLETKQALVDKIRKAVDETKSVIVFSVDNERNNLLKAIREEWKAKGNTSFFMGKNRVMALALGKSEEEEYADGLHRVARLLHGEKRGLMFTDSDVKEVVDYFESHSVQDFARTGGVAPETVTLEAGPLEQFPHSLEPQLRGLGLPTALKKGVVTLIAAHTVCKKGDKLTSEQARILKLLGMQHADFRLNALAVWNKDDGEFKLLREISVVEKENGKNEPEDDSDDEGDMSE